MAGGGGGCLVRRGLVCLGNEGAMLWVALVRGLGMVGVCLGAYLVAGGARLSNAGSGRLNNAYECAARSRVHYNVYEPACCG